MSSTDRRAFLQLLAAGAAGAALPASIARAMAIPANNRTGTIADIEHIVILMQENRSFDHYFGTLQGVRGYSDPRAVTLPSGNPVFYQPDGAGYVLPFHPTAHNLGLQFVEDLAHDWGTTHGAWNEGKYDQWVPNKGTTTMAHYKRQDIPFHYALADAFTICDAYHCALLGPTDPNRYHMWTGYVGNNGKGGGPVVDNAEAGYGWSTYPERLVDAGITWKIYQDIGNGLTAEGYWGWTSNAYIGNYGDNSLLYFHQYQHAKPGTPLYEGALQGTNISVGGTLFDQLLKDVQEGTLPQVSWIVAPEAYTEHPNWPTNYGAWYISQMLDVLTSKPDIWSKTAFFLCYDENDGFFDHMVPATPPQTRAEGLSTVDVTEELFAGSADYAPGPYGLGARVPMIVISPWTKGGYVNSEVFDHTSIIRFIEQRFGPTNPALVEHNITKWRRTVTGDLTSAFNFKTPNDAIVPLPSTEAYIPPNQNRYPDYVPTVPATQKMPKQEAGQRLARALPYNFNVGSTVDIDAATITLKFLNAGTAGAVFQVRSGDATIGPWTYTVSPSHHLADVWNTSLTGGLYDLSVYAPNGFFRAYRGSTVPGTSANLVSSVTYDTKGIGLTLTVTNKGPACTVTVLDTYTNQTTAQLLPQGDSLKTYFARKALYGWYDLVITCDIDSIFGQRLAGHIETGKDSATDPAIGGLGAT
jgi:phospholipase C